MPKFLSGGMTKKEAVKYSISIFKYISRTSFRSTPFGAFAGIDLGSLEQRSSIKLSNEARSKLKLRFDTIVENYLLNTVLTHKQLQDLITFSLNNTIYRVKDSFRFYEKKDIGSKIEYVISSVPAEEHITFLIKNLKQTFSKNDFFELMSQFSDNREEIQSFFDDLFSNSFILPDLQHYLTEKDLLSEIQVLLRSTQGSTKYKFSWIQSFVNYIKDFNSGVQDHESLLDQMHRNIPTAPINNYFQADLDLNFDQFSLSTKVLNKLIVQVKQLMNKLAYKERNLKLLRFAQKFQEHFGEKEVPLLLAVDPEVGVSYDESESLTSPLLDGLDLYQIDNDIDSNKRNNTTLNIFKNKIAQKSIVSGFSEIVLEDKDLEDLKGSVDNDVFIANQDFYVLGSIICSSVEQFDRDNYLFDLKAVVHSSATKLASRFGHLKEEVKDWNKELYRMTNGSDNDEIVAEIVHLPDYSVGNVLKRPTLADYEIPFFAASSVPSEQRINLDDLYVSVRNQQVTLRSKKLGKTVCPKLTSAHNLYPPDELQFC